MKFSFQTEALDDGLVRLIILENDKRILHIDCNGATVSELVAILLLSSYDAAQKAPAVSSKKGDLPLVVASKIATLSKRPRPDCEVIVIECGDTEVGVAIPNADLQSLGMLLMSASAERSRPQ